MKNLILISAISLIAMGSLGLYAGTPEEVPDIQSQLEELKESIATLEESLKGAEEARAITEASLSKLEKTKASGYLQARYEADERGKKPKEATFYIRRGRLKVEHKAGDTSALTWQIDAAKDKIVLKDAYIELAFPNSAVKVTFGQFKWAFGYEVPQSSSDREMPERTTVVSNLFPGERDRGLKISGEIGEIPRIGYQLGLYNGTGIEGGWEDTNAHKDLVFRLNGQVTSANLDWGFSGYLGKAYDKAAKKDVDKNRWGFDFQYYMQEASLKGEYIKGKDADIDSIGWYTQYAKNLRVSDTIVLKYDLWDHNTSLSGDKITTLGLAWLHYIDEPTKLTLAYQMPKEETQSIANNLLTLQLQYKF